MKIHIDRLQLHLKGISPSLARSAINGLGQEVLKQLSEGKLKTQNNNINIDTVQAGRVKLKQNTSTTNLTQQMAKAVAGAVKSSSEGS